jgi:hypothetical protein
VPYQVGAPGLLHLTRGIVKTISAPSVELARAGEFQWNSRARRPSGGTEEVSDGDERARPADKPPED